VNGEADNDGLAGWAGGSLRCDRVDANVLAASYLALR
jgi:hypothetical protein